MAEEISGLPTYWTAKAWTVFFPGLSEEIARKIENWARDEGILAEAIDPDAMFGCWFDRTSAAALLADLRPGATRELIVKDRDEDPVRVDSTYLVSELEEFLGEDPPSITEAAADDGGSEESHA